VRPATFADQLKPTFAGLLVVLGIFRPVEARCKEIQLVTDCAGG